MVQRWGTLEDSEMATDIAKRSVCHVGDDWCGVAEDRHFAMSNGRRPSMSRWREQMARATLLKG